MSSKWLIRPAAESDYAAMDRLQTASVHGLCAEVYTPDLIESWVGRPKPERYAKGVEMGALYYVALENTALRGFCGIDLAERLVLAVFAHPDAAGQGVGSLMMEYLFDLAARSGINELRVESSLNAVGFYCRHGFAGYDRSQVRLSTGQKIDGVLMRRTRQPEDDNPAAIDTAKLWD